MPRVGKIEKTTQERVLALLRQRMGCTCLGDCIDRPANSDIEPDLLKTWLALQGISVPTWCCSERAARPGHNPSNVCDPSDHRSALRLALA